MEYSFDSRGDCTVSSSLFWEKRERKREAQEKERIALYINGKAVYRQCKQEKENDLSENNKKTTLTKGFDGRLDEGPSV